MPRKKVNLQYIPNNSTRRATFQKRSNGMMKKAGELATLCDAKACVLIYGEGESVPHVYPPSHDEAVAILNRFKDMPEHNQCKKTTDQESFLIQRIAKLQNQIQKSRSDCEEHEIRILLHKVMMGKFPGLMGLSIEDLTKLNLKVGVLLKSIGERIAKIQDQPPVYQSSPVQVPSPTITNGMGIIGHEAINLGKEPSQLQEGWIDMMRSGGGDIGSLLHGSFKDNNGGGTSNVSFHGGEMIQNFDLGDGLGVHGKSLMQDL
ncbi:agamous-like MADS-box protein AGL80 [Lolium rigidum]|uniref:agamous-like MADS-box protein AGL80 n=1 Tax=Lolium rigidum TaxID=89674 RepID=UPI001F5D525B|nr:agamous-like MADS-box protein AGL80 [Lolium rigidum]